jgi:hypothetical protein
VYLSLGVISKESFEYTLSFFTMKNNIFTNLATALEVTGQDEETTILKQRNLQ